MEKNKKLDKMKDFVVIGLGRFGKSVALELFAMGKEVMAIDKNSANVSVLADKVSSAVTADASSYEILQSLGIQDLDCAIVCIGEELESSLLVVQSCKELGVKYIIAKAKSEHHSKILYALGVDLVIFPESFAGKKLANMLATPGINELVHLTDDYKIFEMPIPEVWKDKLVKDLNMPRKYKMSIVFIKRGDEVVSPEADMQLLEGDTLVLAGLSSKINNLSDLVSTQEDINNSLKDVFGS